MLTPRLALEIALAMFRTIVILYSPTLLLLILLLLIATFHGKL